MTNIYKNVQTAIDNNNNPALWLELGKIWKLLLDFEPIEAAANPLTLK
jgi:hypothetical protein